MSTYGQNIMLNVLLFIISMLNNVLLFIISMLNNASLEIKEKKKQYAPVP